MPINKSLGRTALLLCPVLVAVFLAPGCDSSSSNNEAEQVKPEVRAQIQETISKTYSQDYRAKYAKKKN